MLLVLMVFAMAGCAFVAENETRQQVLWLEKAGFRVAPRVPSGAQARTNSPFREIVRSDGSIAYYFADPQSRTVYAGGEEQMAAFREIALRDRARRSANLARMTPGSMRINGPMVW